MYLQHVEISTILERIYPSFGDSAQRIQNAMRTVIYVSFATNVWYPWSFQTVKHLTFIVVFVSNRKKYITIDCYMFCFNLPSSLMGATNANRMMTFRGIRYLVVGQITLPSIIVLWQYNKNRIVFKSHCFQKWEIGL